MRRTASLAFVALSVVWLLGASPAQANEGITAQLNGFEETPVTLLGDGTGVFLGLIPTDQNTIVFQLFYTDLSGTPTAAHIHFGKPGESGGVAAFLCGGSTKPACPASGTFFQGVIAPDDVLALPAQDLAAGDLAGLIRAINSGFAYVNVHTAAHPPGEIRGQLKGSGR
jgi:hypothetical protein